MVKTTTQLGKLEIAILECLWRGGENDAQSLHHYLQGQRRVSLSTVQSTLERLFRKGLVNRQKISHAYRYQARLQRRELLGSMINDVVRQLGGGQLEPILSSFVDYAEQIDETSLNQLEELVAQRRRKQEEQD